MSKTDILHTIVQLVAIVCDCSTSMDTPSKATNNKPIHDLNVALKRLYADLLRVKHFRVELLHVRFADVAHVQQDFEPVQTSQAPTYKTFGDATDYSLGIGRAMVELEERRATLRATGLEVNQPWIVFLTDAKPNRCANSGYEVELLGSINANKLVFIPVAVGGSTSLDALRAISPKQEPIVVDSNQVENSLSFEQFFKWLSDSIQSGKPLNQNTPEDDDLGE